MASSSQENSSGLLDQSIPLWKRELILRRRAIIGRSVTAGSIKFSCVDLASGPSALKQQQLADFHLTVGTNMRLVEHRDPLSEIDSGHNGLTDSVKYLSTNMVDEKCRRSAAVNNMRALNENNNRRTDTECQSDSSEELQYGPGIVNKLKSKYLSLTLRESQNRGVRPSLANIRRYASMENILDNDLGTAGKPQITAPHFVKRADAVGNNATKMEAISQHHQRYRAAGRASRKDSVKRARSVETLHRYDSKLLDGSNEDVNKNRPVSLLSNEIVIIENKMKTEATDRTENKVPPTKDTTVPLPKPRLHVSVPLEKELPPPDTVKQTLKIFECPSSRKAVKTKPKNTVNINKTSASLVKSISNKYKPLTLKPSLSPKPQASVVPPVCAPRKPVPTGESSSHPVDRTTPNVSPAANRKAKAPSPPFSLRKLISSPECVLLSTAEPSPRLTNGEEKYVSLVEEDHFSSNSDDLDGIISSKKPIPKSALENIRKDGLSLHFSFNGTNNSASEKPKSYLPNGSVTPAVQNNSSHETIRLHSPPAPTPPNTSFLSAKSPETIRLHSPPAPTPANTSSLSAKSPETIRLPSPPAPTPAKSPENIRLPSPPAPTPAKSPETIRLPSTPAPTPAKSPETIRLPYPPAPTPAAISPALVKSSEAPHFRQIGVIRPLITNKAPSLTEREIEKNLINLGKSTLELRSSPKVSEVSVSSAVKASAQGLWDKKKPWNQQQNTVVFNFSTTKGPVPDYIENDGLILRSKRDKSKSGVELLEESEDSLWPSPPSPPSPCDILFEGGNVVINGRSSLVKTPRTRKLRIQFDDSLTSTFEYPSEASLLEESAPTAAPLGGGSLSSYTPSKVHLGTENFQLGITRATPPPPVPSPPPARDTDDIEEYLKPALDEDTVPWSAETAADLLF